jgi:hypothetical protein
MQASIGYHCISSSCCQQVKVICSGIKQQIWLPLWCMCAPLLLLVVRSLLPFVFYLLLWPLLLSC